MILLKEQRYLSYEEYEALGYQLKQDVQFADGSYSSYRIDLNPFDWAYRSDTKEEYYRDFTVAIIELGLDLTTGPAGRAGRRAWSIIKELVIDD